MNTGQVLFDTSSLLLLIRTVPNMFIDTKYGCCTIEGVRNEFFKTPKFRSKYPWRNQFKDKIACLPEDISSSPDVSRYHEAISCLLDVGINNKKDGGLFDLSPVDKQVLACSLGNGLMISTCDQPLEDFAKQEFRREFKGSISPLGVLNLWLSKGLVFMSDSIYAVISDWRSCEEPAQPGRQKRTFQLITEKPYPGS